MKSCHRDQGPAASSWSSCLAGDACPRGSGAVDAAKVRLADSWGAAVVDAAGAADQVGFVANVPW